MQQRITPVKYYFTNYGDIYAGLLDEYAFDDYNVIVPLIKSKDYNNLKSEERTFEKVEEYGWITHKDTIVNTIDGNKISIPKQSHIPDWWEGEYDRKIMFIVGAGASANCVTGVEKSAFEKDRYRPPLGNELFDHRFKEHYRKYPGVKLSLNYLQDKGADIEKMLEDDWKEIRNNSNDSIMSRHINIQFYLLEILKTVSYQTVHEYDTTNLFAKLADRAQRIYSKNRKRKFAFVSFNQDTILESFLCRHFFHREMDLMTMDNYAEKNNSPFCVFKPHGSWNWGWKLTDETLGKIKVNGTLPEGLFHHSITLHDLYFRLLGNYQEMVDWNSYGLELEINKHRKGRITIDKSKISIMSNADANNQNYYPALLLPYRDKDEFTMPILHYKRLRTYLGYVETLIIIGWKGNEAAFNRMLFKEGKKIRRVIIVDTNPAVVEENLKPLLSQASVEKISYEKGFEDFITNGLEKELNQIL